MSQLDQVNTMIQGGHILRCISLLREQTKCFNLIELLCEKVVDDPNIEKTDSFWDDYGIALFYLGKISKAYSCYKNIFPHSKTKLNEREVNHFLNNLNWCIPGNMKIFPGLSRSLEYFIKRNNVTLKEFHFEDKPNDFNFMNPSILRTEDGYIMSIRAVNYTLNENFSYTGCGKYYTLNYIAELDKNLNITSVKQMTHTPMPFTGDFSGWEDMRVFNYKNKMCGSFTTLDATQHRLQHICVSDLSEEQPRHILLDGYGKGSIQKNWTPLVKGDNLYFVYSFFPLIILKYNTQIRNVVLHQVSLPVSFNKWRGGSPAVSLAELGYPNFYLCVIHESNFPMYTQRFVLLKLIDNKNDVFEIYNYSPSFHFIDPQIEFCAGLTISHNRNEFIMSFGKLDRQVHIAKANVNAVLNGLMSEKLKLIEYPINEKKLNSPYTFVTSFFNLEKLEGKERLHRTSMYIDKAKTLLNLDINLVIYCDDDEMIDNIEEIRKKYPNKTKIIKTQITDLPYYRHYDFIKNKREENDYAGYTKTKDTPLFTILQWSKFHFLRDAIEGNYFNDNYYMWIDFGIAYVATMDNYISSFNKKSDKITLLCINLPTSSILVIPSLNRWLCYVAAGLFGGSKENMKEFINKFDEALGVMVRNNVAPLEEVIMAYVSYLNPHLFEFYYGDYYDIIDNRSRLYSTKHIHLIMDNIKKAAIQEKSTLKACHLINYISSSFNNGDIQLSNENLACINAFRNCFFFDKSEK
jgi:hypothetical protein